MGKATDSMSRRTFVALSGGVIGSMAAAGCAQKPAEQAASAPEPAKTAPVDPYAGFRMGMQTWCVREFKSTDDVIKSLHELGLKYVEIAPTIHLPEDTPPDEIKATVERYKSEGITIDSCGVSRMPNDEASCRKVFEYAKLLGVLAIDVAPEYEALPLVDRLTEEYGLPVAIHNHGPEDKLYAKPEMYRQYLAKTSTRVGLCLDTGHSQRSGVNPLRVIDEFPDRIRGMHIKDMVPVVEGGHWEDAIVGRGLLYLPCLLGKLKEIGFNGFFSLEYESDPSNPLPAMKECLAEIRKACAALA